MRGHNWTGSLVMANAKDLKHPEYINGRISGYYIFFGIVTALNVTYDPNKLNGIWGAPPSDELIVDWIGVENGHSLIKSDNALDNSLFDSSAKKFKVSAVSRKKVHLLADATNPHLDGLNYFLKSAVLESYFYIKPHGWCEIRHSHKLLYKDAE